MAESQQRKENKNGDILKQEMLTEAAAYFRQKGYQRLLLLMLEKYQSLGRWAGTVKLNNLLPEEQEVLSLFFRRDYHYQKSATIQLNSFAEALEQTKFAEIPLLELLEYVAGESVLTRQEQEKERERKRKEYFEELRLLYPADFCQTWLDGIEKKADKTRSVQLAYEKDAAGLNQYLQHVLKALTILDEDQKQELKRIRRLPVFALEITQNPHGFDLDTETGKLLLNALGYLRAVNGQTPEKQEVLSGTEIINELLYHYGILRDDIWNFVTCTGLKVKDSRGEELAVWKAAYQDQAVLNIPLREMVKVERVYPYMPEENSKANNKIYVVENPAVFSSLVDLAQKEQISVPLICTHGQFKLTALILLDKVAATGTKIYYSGDYDPEGVVMAQNLLNRYPQAVIPWHYSPQGYLFSKPAIKITENRLEKLKKIHSPGLTAIKNKILELQLAGYQEGILPLLAEDVLNS